MITEAQIVTSLLAVAKPLISLITEEIKQAWGVGDELAKLERTLIAIEKRCGSAAEETPGKNTDLEFWLVNLRDVVCDIEDVLDEFFYQSKHYHKHKTKTLISIYNPVIFASRMSREIRSINKRLDEIHANCGRYMVKRVEITNQFNHSSEQTTVGQRNMQETGQGKDPTLFGREGVVKDISELLKSTVLPSSSAIASDESNTVSTLCIVGMGGLGKTAVAKLLYNDTKLSFQRKAWVSVSEVFDLYKILGDILQSSAGKNYNKPSNVDVLTQEIRDMLTGKRFLIVLDNLWNEDTHDWLKLKRYLDYGSSGSIILITTRSQQVATTVNGKIFTLDRLSDDVCWKILERQVGGAEALTPNLIRIGKEIATKCDGLPLAVIFLGGLMVLKKEEKYWSAILEEDNSSWTKSRDYEKLISILKLSYDRLSPPLKLCFSYCCVFPKDWVIEREMLIGLWMAEGLLSSSDETGQKSAEEDLGNAYFECLVWSSFFQDLELDAFGAIDSCKMHDLVHDLATRLTHPREFSTAMLVGDKKTDLSGFRRIRVETFKGTSASPQQLKNAAKLRTVISLNQRDLPPIDSLFQHTRLRVLCVRNNNFICSLSSQADFSNLWSTPSTSNLRHLRYLNLSFTILSPKMSLNELYLLETLVLHCCRGIPSGLLAEVSSSPNLRHIDLSGSDIKDIPEDIGELEKLSYFDLTSTDISKVPDSITRISNLKTLELSHCSRLDAIPIELGSVTGLRRLDLRSTKVRVLPQSCVDNLCSLEFVALGDYCEFPKQVMNWPKLRMFRFTGKTGYASGMPKGIDGLTRLETLDFIVENGSGVSDLAGLNALQELVILSVEKVRGGKDGAETARLKDKQDLRTLSLVWDPICSDEKEEEEKEEEAQYSRSIIDDTVVLDGLKPPPGLLDFSICGFSGQKLPDWMTGSSLSFSLPNLRELTLQGLGNCEKLPGLGMLPFLVVLTLCGMKSVQVLGEEFYLNEADEEQGGFFPSLCLLKLQNLENLEEWFAPPGSLPCFPSLRRLEIKSCKKLRVSPITMMASLEELYLQDVSADVKSLLNGGGGGGQIGHIGIVESPDLTCLPPLGELLQYGTHSLTIFGCSNFQGFSTDEVHNSSNNHSSLRWLSLMCCPALKDIPDLRQFTCLRKLIIFQCKELSKESIPYDLKESLPSVEEFVVDFLVGTTTTKRWKSFLPSCVT